MRMRILNLLGRLALSVKRNVLPTSCRQSSHPTVSLPAGRWQHASGMLLLPFLLCAVITARADSTVVFNEIMYHPATNEAGMEWVELHNQMAVDMDLSAWSLSKSVTFTFPEGTVVPGFGYVVVAGDPATLMAATGLTNVLGPFKGRLSNSGETIELRNRDQRLMDAVTYGVDGDWPVGPDGAGPSLAKFDQDSASALAANWRTSAQLGGTPGAVNFPANEITVSTSSGAVWTSVWKYDASGTDLGAAWSLPAFDDSAWPAGAGLFFAGSVAPGDTGSIPTLFSTGIATNGVAALVGVGDPHYVLTASAYSTPPPPDIAATVEANHSAWLANDATSMWLGPTSQGANSVAAGNYNYRTTFDLTGFDLGSVQITLQMAADNGISDVLLNGASRGFSYAGFNAWSSTFTINSGFTTGTNTLDFLTYNSGTTANPGGFRAKLGSSGMRRPATNTVVALGPTTHYFRKTFAFAGDPALGGLRLRAVVDDGAVFYLNGAEVLRVNMPGGVITNGTPAVTNVPNAGISSSFDLPNASLLAGTNVLAVELHQATDGTNDVMFGAELSVMVTNLPVAPLPKLAWNEIPAVTNKVFWIELLNYGSQSAVLDGQILARYGKNSYYEYALAPHTLAAGGRLVLDKATVGFGADPGDKIVLFTSNKTAVLDAVVAKRYARARFPEGTGAWLEPNTLTPGASNSFAFHREIVINEIMFNPPDLAATPETRYTNLLVTITNGWRYNQSGYNLGTAWTAPAYDDSLWPTGKALFYTNFSTLPAALGTKLRYTNGVVTYYFRTPFVVTNNATGLQVVLRHVINDGAIFYLNGVEITRFNMPAGTVYSTNYASLNIGVPTSILGPYGFTMTNLVTGTNILAVEVHQYAATPVNRDACFGAELSVSGVVSPAMPARSSPEAWVELYNRSTNTVDLTGWSLDNAVHFTFPAGQTMAPDSYLVVAGDAAYLRGVYPAITILGDFTGSLAHSGDDLVLRDPSGNPANEVHYYGATPWPEYPAGGGTSLELRDPWADNSKAEAWTASIESSHSTWAWYTNRTVSANVLGPTIWNEFQMGLLDSGECLIDDLHVTESPTNSPIEFLQNGTFETGLTNWRTLGDHRHSRVEVDPNNAANHVLHLIATGGTEHMHNHLETTYASSRVLTDGRLYEVSFRAKWLAGNNRLNTRLYFNRVAKTFALPMPVLHGTPGARNSTYATNIGPTFESFGHSPVLPKAGDPVTISVDASDPQGVANVTLWWTTNFTAWQTVAMTLGTGAASPDYAHFSTTLAGMPAGTLVQFFVQATDGLGAVAAYPAGGTNSRALFKVDNGAALMTQLHHFRLLMLPAEADFLHAPTNVMSNDRLGMTVIYDDRQVFYDASVHLQSSERGRNDTTRVGYSVKMGADRLFRGTQGGFTVDRSGGYSGRGGDHDELILWHGVNHAGGLLGVECDLAQIFAPRAQEDSTGMIRMSAFDGDYFDSQFASGSRGNLFKLELLYYPTTTATGDAQAPKLPQPDNVINFELQDWGNDQENYRWIFLQQNHADQDDYSEVIAFNQALALTGTNLAARTSQLMDVDEWLRTLAWKAFVCEGDTFTYGNNHNFLIYFRPADGKVLGLVWDEDYSFVTAINSGFPGTSSANMYKLITSIPDNYRRYYNHLLDIMTTTVNSAHLQPWATRYSRLVGQDWSAAVNYLQQRADYIRTFMPTNAPFAITSNNGNDFSATSNQVTLTGTAPMTVKNIEVNGLTFPLTWTSMTNWAITIPLPTYTNFLVVQGVDNSGNRPTNAYDSITITNSGVLAQLPVVINEWMADNAGPGGYPDPLDGAFKDWFELYNPNPSPVNLSSFYLTDTLANPTKCLIPSNTVIAAHGFLLVWADNQPGTTALSTNGALHANFQLNNSGESLGLFAPDGSAQHSLLFGLQSQNVSQGLYPDGNTGGEFYFMPNWTPHAANQLGSPTSPDLVQIAIQTGTNISFSFPVLPNRTYRVDYKEDLGALDWIPLATNRVTSAGVFVIQDTITDRTQRFYRSVLLQ